MVAKKFHKNRLKRPQFSPAKMMVAIREKKLIEANYNFLRCRMVNGKLICIGTTKPTAYSKEYKFKLIYDGVSTPEVFVVSPQIDYNDEIHMFPKNNSLCLFHSKTDDFVWDFRKHNLFDTIIPWTLEWFVYYELYLITGKWEHPFIEHRKSKEKN